MANKEFLQRTVKTMNRKFIGFDLRILPLLGVISLVASAICFWQYRWADWLALIALLVISICWSLAVHDVWKEDNIAWGNDRKKLAYFEALVEKRKESPRLFVFPYIRSINASSIVYADEEYLEISVYFPTSHLEEKELNLTGELILDGLKSKILEIKSCTITPDGVAQIISWHVELGNQLLQHVKQKIEINSPVQATLKLHDINNREYSLETETWTTLLLTKTS